jgi:uncharacterized protein
MSQNDARLGRELYGFLRRHNVMNLAYQDAEGPGACAVWFSVDEELSCYFLAATSTRHGAALHSGGQIAFTVQKDEQHWLSIQGVQGTGWCAPIEPEQRERAWQTYSGRFPFVLQQFPSIAAALLRMTLWVVTPHWLRLIDNTKGFGHKEELLLRTRTN